MKGRLPFPLPGRAEIRSARRPGADGPGLEMRVPRGSPVRAVYAGRVAFADSYAAYGKTIILDHGNSYYTVSANLEDIAGQGRRRGHRGDAHRFGGRHGPGGHAVFRDPRGHGYGGSRRVVWDLRFNSNSVIGFRREGYVPFLTEVHNVSRRVQPGGPATGVSPTTSAPRVTPAPARPFKQVMNASAGAIISGRGSRRTPPSRRAHLGGSG